MLEDLRRFKNLGTPNYFFELFSILNSKQNINFTTKDIQEFFHNRTIDGRSIFDGCIELAIKTDILVKQGNSLFLKKEVVNTLNSISDLKDNIIESLLNALKDDNEFQKIFSSENLSHDINYKSFLINNRAFGLKYSSFKQFLIDFEALKSHPITEINCFIINNRYKKLFGKVLLSTIRKRKISIEEFRSAMEQQQIFGEEAERFVLDFEVNRLNNLREVDWVAEFVVNEGYDIASYNHESDEFPNRFIEVKSYDGDSPYFYWSRNEYTIAKSKREKYWLYLVNRSEMNKSGYSPIMIQNPYEAVLNDCVNWEKTIEKYKVEFINSY